MTRLLSLPHLPAFEAAARRSSFSAAADELFITTGAVSRHIRTLEEQLGVQLFYRAHKSVRLTSAGETFSRVATRLLDELAQAEKEVSANVFSGRLTVQCLPTFAMHWLMPRLAELNEVHPELTVDVTTSIGPVSFASPFDIAIRRDPAHFSGLKPVPFLRESSLLVCSQQYLHSRPLVSPDQLGDHIKIQIRARNDLWKRWHSHFPNDHHESNQIITLDHTFAAMQAAEDGLGLVVMPYLFCEKHLKTGRLVAPFGDLTIDTGTYSLLWNDRQDEAVRKFTHWLQSFELPAETSLPFTSEHTVTR
ncbi:MULTISPECIES: LysR substrate-binding domain-containing protein [unclassified Citrobacter]|uniref:LysR substrate-binding domain-containing protein n=1 Tax=unclassified Citrobacter TaxID=2644389 RepID=UPI00107A3737|nr:MULTISPECIES: LysR substrate-binding domain-containing protein [unclassified Citrobacter]MDA8514277.1 LysR substrate-binding domain-containing protein [Citrobacter sp. Igbk 14]MDA8518169.1 LysR substrate-binding domain-containing protein [Citrobacter sp. Igbk 16]